MLLKVMYLPPYGLKGLGKTDMLLSPSVRATCPEALSPTSPATMATSPSRRNGVTKRFGPSY